MPRQSINSPVTAAIGAYLGCWVPFSGYLPRLPAGHVHTTPTASIPYRPTLVFQSTHGPAGRLSITGPQPSPAFSRSRRIDSNPNRNQNEFPASLPQPCRTRHNRRFVSRCLLFSFSTTAKASFTCSSIHFLSSYSHTADSDTPFPYPSLPVGNVTNCHSQ